MRWLIVICPSLRPRTVALLHWRLEFGISLQLGCWCLELPSLRRGSLLLFADYRRDRLQFVALSQIDELHTLRIAAGLPDILHKCSHHLAAICDQHDFI